MRDINKKYSKGDPNKPVGADLFYPSTEHNNVIKTELEDFITSSGQTIGATIGITSLGQTGGTATAVTASPHGMVTGQWVDIVGVEALTEYTRLRYNGVHQITVTGASTFEFDIPPDTPSPATGTILFYPPQIERGVANYAASGMSWKEASGSAADAYVLERVGIPDLAIPTGFYEGAKFEFEVVNANTGGAATVEIPLIGTKNIKTAAGNDPPAGFLSVGKIVTLRYDGVNMVIETGGLDAIVDTYHLAAYTVPIDANWALLSPSVSITVSTNGNPIFVILNVDRAFIGTGTTDFRLGVDVVTDPLVPIMQSYSYNVGQLVLDGYCLHRVFSWVAGTYNFRAIVRNGGGSVAGGLSYTTLTAFEVK